MGFHLTLSEENERKSDGGKEEDKSQIALHSYGQPFKEFQQIRGRNVNIKKKSINNKNNALHSIKIMWKKHTPR